MAVCSFVRFSIKYDLYLFFPGGAVVALLVCWTSDLEVGDSTPSPCACHHILSLDKKLYPILSLFTQVHKMGTGDILLGVTMR